MLEVSKFTLCLLKFAADAAYVQLKLLLESDVLPDITLELLYYLFVLILNLLDILALSLDMISL